MADDHAILAPVLQPLRTLISLAFIAGLVWFSFAVKLGNRTLAEHIDRIGQTDEAKDLVEGTRSTVTPVLEEAKQRVLGEHVEAPTTAVPPADSASLARQGPTRATVGPSTENATKLPRARKHADARPPLAP
jgi:hypothetical protein